MRVLLALGLASLCSAAVAQDHSGGSTDWTGFYAGVGVGYSQTDIHTALDEDTHWEASAGWIPGDGMTEDLPAMPAGWPASGHLVAGYGAQIGSAYLAVEGDLEWQEATTAPVWIRGNSRGPTGTDTGACPDGAYDFCLMEGGRSAFTRLGHVRAITGVVLDSKVMAFAAGGLAFGRAKAGMFAYMNNDGVIESDFDIPSSLLVGLSLGGGVEFKPTDGFRIRVEGLLDSYPDWAATDEVNIGDPEGFEEPFVRMKLPLISGISNATARVSAIWQF